MSRWIERDPIRGWVLKAPGPTVEAEYLEARAEAVGIMNACAGPGAKAYEEARLIFAMVSDDLQRLAAVRGGAITVHGNVHQSHLIQHNTGGSTPLKGNSTMASADQIRATQAKRFAFLQYMYEHAHRGGTSDRDVNTDDLRAALRLDPEEANRIEQYLEEKGLIEFTVMGPHAAITNYGIDYVESALAQPDEPTPFFPPVNILNIGTVSHSQIQQGTTQSTQSGEWHGASGADLAKMVGELRDALEKSGVHGDDRTELDAQIKTLEAQATSKRPNSTIVREALGTLRSVGEQIGAGLIVAKAAAMLGLL